MNDTRLGVLHDMVYEAGYLKQVKYLCWKGFTDSIIAVILTFTNKTFTVCAIPSDDTIEVIANQLSLDSESEIILATEREPWSRAIGRRTLWAWNLTNQQGYPDSLQFCFANAESQEDIIIQLITVASCLNIYELNQIK